METTARNRTIGGIVIGAIILILLLVLFSCTVGGDPKSSPTNDPTPGESSSLPSDPDTIEPEEDPSESESESDEPEEIDGDDIVPAANTGVTFIPAGNVPSGSTPTCDLDPSACEPNRPPGAGVDICEIRPDLNQCQEPDPVPTDPTLPPDDGETTPPDDDCFLEVGPICIPGDGDGGGDGGDGGDGDGEQPGPIDKTKPKCTTPPVVTSKSDLLGIKLSYTVEWGEATDNSNAVEYLVVVDGGEVTRTTQTSYTARLPLSADVLSVVAVDPADNRRECGSVLLSDDVAPEMGPVDCVVLSSTELKLTWGDATDDSGRIHHYTVTNDEGKQAAEQTKNSATYTGLKPGTQYNFEVTATDWSYNHSEPSIPDCSPTDDDDQAPSPPKDLMVTSESSTSVSLKWSASNDNSAIDYYEVTYAGVEDGVSGGTGRTDGPVTTLTVSPLSPSTAYKFSVVAFDVAGNKSGSSNEAVGTTTALGEGARTVQPRTLKKSSTEAPADRPAEKPTDEKSPLLPGLGDILPGGEDTAEAPAEEPAAPEAEPSESESPAARPVPEEPVEEATEKAADESTEKAAEDAPAEEEKDEDGLLKNIGDAVVSAVAAVF